MNEFVESVRQILVTTPDRWLVLAESADTDALRRVPADGQWSAVECLAHLYGIRAQRSGRPSAPEFRLVRESVCPGSA